MDAQPGANSTPASTGTQLKVVLLHAHQGPKDDRVAAVLHEHLSQEEHDVAVDRSQTGSIDWAVRIQQMIEEADAVVPLISQQSASDEVMGFEVEVAQEAQRRRKGRPVLLPVRVDYTGPLPAPSGAILDQLPYQLWEREEDEPGILAEIDEILRHLPEGVLPPPAPRRTGLASIIAPAGPRLEPVGGAVPLHSEFYISRPADEQLLHAVGELESVVLIKGARQIGKTSLLARGLDAARKNGARVTLTDFQTFSSTNLESPSSVYLSLAESLVDQLELSVDPTEMWDERRGANVNFERFIRREVLSKIEGPLVWGLDEVDRLLVTDYATEVFGLFRAWHNSRSLDPTGPWNSLTLLIAYATEAHLFIRDPNQSPFNVGTRLVIDDFTREQVSDLNHRHGSPLKGVEEVGRFIRLVGGHPYLVRRGLQEITGRKLDISVFEARAALDDGIFGDHLRRILMLLARNTDLMQVVKGILLGRRTDDTEAFYRLRSAGVMSGASPEDMGPRCQLYASYLRRHLI
jgi:hypothetical protein